MYEVYMLVLTHVFILHICVYVNICLCIQELRRVIVPVYSDFYRTYSKEQFSKKHMSEYLLYEPAYVDRLISGYFDFSGGGGGGGGR